MAALASAVWCHGRLQDRIAHPALAASRRVKKTHVKKTKKQPKKTSCSH